jgi:hypothetical protein
MNIVVVLLAVLVLAGVVVAVLPLWLPGARGSGS